MKRYEIIRNVKHRGTIYRAGTIAKLELSDEMERILIEKQCIKPAVTPVTYELEEVMEDGTDYGRDEREGLLHQRKQPRRQRKRK